jgi:hypothetical protein
MRGNLHPCKQVLEALSNNVRLERGLIFSYIIIEIRPKDSGYNPPETCLTFISKDLNCSKERNSQADDGGQTA